MTLKVAFVTVGRMVLPAVDAVGGMQWHTRHHGKNRRGHLCVTLAASSQSPVVVSAVGAHAKWTLCLERPAHGGWVAPLPAPLAKSHARIGLGCSDEGYSSPHLEGYNVLHLELYWDNDYKSRKVIPYSNHILPVSLMTDA